VSARRWYGALVSVAMLGAVAWPLTRAPGRLENDSFPLSTYPMFAVPRSTRVELRYAVGVVPGHPSRFLTPSLVGSHEVLQAMMLVQHAVNGGPSAIDDLCRAVAARVAVDDEYRDVTAVAIVRGVHDAVDLLVRGVRGSERELGRCPLERR
jgi:hypothetical protein